MITEFSFGRIVVEGQTYSNDIKIVDGKLVPDWWRQSGHAVEIDEVQDILDFVYHYFSDLVTYF